MAIPVISTRHIKAADNEALKVEAPLGGPVCRIWDQGFLLVIEDWDSEEMSVSAECSALIAEFAARGYAYLRLDPDGDVLDHLPQFDW